MTDEPKIGSPDSFGWQLVIKNEHGLNMWEMPNGNRFVMPPDTKLKRTRAPDDSGWLYEVI